MLHTRNGSMTQKWLKTYNLDKCKHFFSSISPVSSYYVQNNWLLYVSYSTVYQPVIIILVDAITIENGIILVWYLQKNNYTRCFHWISYNDQLKCIVLVVLWRIERRLPEKTTAWSHFYYINTIRALVVVVFVVFFRRFIFCVTWRSTIKGKIAFTDQLASRDTRQMNYFNKNYPENIIKNLKTGDNNRMKMK